MDRGNLDDNCSYGNAGYVCPSHFVPLASPRHYKAGLKWMFNSRSPFYIQPRINKDLFNWAIYFIKNSSAEHHKPLRTLPPRRPAKPLMKVPGRHCLAFNFSYVCKIA